MPFISLDTLFWKPNWQASTTDELNQKVKAALALASDGWVIEGGYTSRLSSNTGLQLCTDKICTSVSSNHYPKCQKLCSIQGLDTPLALSLPRLIWRTLLGLVRLRAPCSPGCAERFSEVFFSRKSIVWWCIVHHRPVQKRHVRELEEDDVRNGGPGIMRRIGGWGGELDAWVLAVKDMVERKDD